jgi:hypothetical protein
MRFEVPVGFSEGDGCFIDYAAFNTFIISKRVLCSTTEVCPIFGGTQDLFRLFLFSRNRTPDFQVKIVVCHRESVWLVF